MRIPGDEPAADWNCGIMASHPENSVKHSYCDSVLDSCPPIPSSLVAIKLVQSRHSTAACFDFKDFERFTWFIKMFVIARRGRERFNEELKRIERFVIAPSGREPYWAIDGSP